MSINIGDNFSYLGKKFLDNRQSFDTLELMNNCSDVPLGFITYCKEDNKRYEYSDAGWIEYKSSITDEEAEKLNIAYLHSQTTHVQASDLEGFATEEFVTNKIAEAELGSEEVDLSGYVSKEELEGKGYLTGIPEEYVTDEELNAKGYLTEHQDLSDYATKEYVDEAVSNIDISGGGNVDIDLSNYVTNDKLQEGLANKFDNVEVNEAETNDNQTALDFYANGEVVKTVYFSGGGGGSTIIPPYISTILPENSILGLGGTFNLQLDFSSSVTGRGTAKIFVNDVESISMSIPQGENTIPMADTYFTKGNNRVTVYVIDRTGQMSNSLTFYVRYGSLEITSDFDAYTAYEPGAVVRYYFTPTAVDTSLALTMYMKIDGEVKDGVSCSSDTRGYFTFPNNLEVGAHFCQAYVMDSAGSTSNVLSFNFIILDAVSLVVASDTVNPIVEEGEQLSIDYKVYMRGATSFITKTYIDENLVNTGTCGLDFAYYRTNTLTEGIHTIKMEVYDVTETVSDYIIWTVTVTPSTYEMLQPVKAGSLFIGTAQNMTNSSENKEVWRGTDQDGAVVDGILHNFAFNSESGWVDDELLISGASSVEIPITPLANNARYGFTLDIEFASKMIGVDDALVLNLWDDEKDCGIKITTEQVILRSAEGNQADLYFTDSEMTSVMFVIDRNEATAKIYLNGVMCSAFHLSDYSIDGVPYLEDFTVNNTIMLGGSGHARIKNLRVYQVALSTDEILNNFMANETRKAEQKALVEFQKGNHLPTLTIYCDFSGLGKDDKKPCAITYVSTDEEKYGKSFTLTHKKSTCQYQGTSSMAYPIKNYRINLADEKGEKWKYDFPYGQPERRYTLKADFMSSGHWTNTGLTKWINKNLYNYDLDDEKTMNPKKWYDINNGGSIDDTRECIYGFPCRLILVNDGNTPLNEGQNEPTPGNTKDMGIFNFNHDKDATDTMGFDDDVFPNCASYEVTANSDTSAGAFMKNSKRAYANVNSVNRIDGISLSLLDVKVGDTITLSCDKGKVGYEMMGTKGALSTDYTITPEGKTVTIPSGTLEINLWIQDKTSCIIFNGIPIYNTEEPLEDVIVFEGLSDLDYIKQSFELRFPDEDDVPEGWGFMGVEGEDFFVDYQGSYKDTTVMKIREDRTYTITTSTGDDYMIGYFDDDGYIKDGTLRVASGTTTIVPEIANGRVVTHITIRDWSKGDYITVNGIKYTFGKEVAFRTYAEPYKVTDPTTGLKALIDWVDGCTDEEFVRDFDQHFNRDYTLRYFLLVITLGMVDNLGKNMMLDTWDNKIFMPRFYDCDTICSYDNSGQLKFGVDIEMAQGYWNTSTSRLWTRIRDLMHDELVAKYNNMRQNGMSYESFMECFYDEQIAKIPQKYYNMDYDVKYGPFADSYIGMANGDTYEHLKRWLQQRLRFVDTLYDYAPSYNNDVLTIRANTTEPMTLEIETYTPVYQHLSWYNNQMDKKKIDGKTSVSFTGTAMAATDQEVLIYGGSNIKSIKGISSMNPNRMLIGSATRLIELDAPNCPLLADINANKANLAPHIYLNRVDLSGCPLLGGNLIVNQSPLVREIDIRGTAITGLNLPPSLRNLEVLKLPAAISNLVLNDAGQLHTLELEEGGTLQSVSMTNCNALTNVTNFNLEDATSITLNNSYNTVDELYFSKATNLSVSNMANLERVIYTPNAEHEVFDKANVDNAQNYTISTFNCPKLSTFMTTAPYRNSYDNNCEIIDILYTGPGYQTVLEAYNPNGTRFKHELSDCIFNRDNGIEIEIDVSSCKNTNENIISIGMTRIDYFKDNKAYHFYFTAETRLLQMYDGSTAITTKITLEQNENIVRIKLNKSGMFINDICYASYSFDKSTDTVLVGSEEGSNRSNATINHLRYYTKVTDVTIQAKDYGEKKPNEVFEANVLDISSTQFTDVKLLCTTDANKLLLPRTVKNLVVDSAYDLDTEYLTDGDYDTIHDDLYEPYNTDYEESVTRSENVTELITWYTGNFNTIYPSISWGDKYSDKIYVMEGSSYTVQPVVSIGAWFKAFGFDSSDTVIWQHGGSITSDTTACAGTIPNGVVYIRFSCNGGSDVTITYTKPYTPNLVPSASDGSLIFSMYAPHNTTEPASGVWDLKGFEFDTFHTFGLNNDVKPIYGYTEKSIVLEGTNLNWEFSYGSRHHTYVLNNGFKSITPLLCNGHIIVCRDKDGNVVENHKFIDKDKTVEIPANTYEIELECYTAETSIVSYNVVYDEPGITQIQMPNRLDEYSYKLDNLRLPNEVVNYTASDANTFPTFNAEFKYSYIINEEDGVYIYRILADDMDNLPTSISFNDKTNLLSVEYLNTSNITTMFYMFNNCTNLTTLDTSNWDTSKVTSMYGMFRGCSNLTSLDASNWDTKIVTNTSYMFNGCNNLTSLYTSNWDTKNINNMSYMFNCCNNLTSLDASNWDTGKVADMSGMFNGCSSLTSLDLSGWNTSKVTTMYSMFMDCTNLTSLDTSGWVTSEVTTMSGMFRNCSSLTSLDTSNWNTGKVTNMHSMFRNCSSLTSLDTSNWNTGKVTNIDSMFRNCSSLTSLDTSNWNTGKVTNIDSIFSTCRSLTSIDLSSSDISSVTSTMSSMFYACNSLTSLNVTNWPLTDKTQSAIDSLPVGDDAKNIVYATVYFTVPSGWTLDHALEIIRYTANASGVKPDLKNFTAYSLSEIDNGDGTYTVRISANSLDNLPTSISFYNKTNLLTVEKMNTSKLTDMRSMFQICNNLTYVNTSNWDTSNVTSMSHMFSSCSNLKSLDVSSWNTGKVTDMSTMFNDCKNLTSIEGIGEWNTSNVTNMSQMFLNCESLTNIEGIRAWNTSNVTTMNSMFNNCKSLESIDLSNWDTGKVGNMSAMFYHCEKLTEVIGMDTWYCPKLTAIDAMFQACYKLSKIVTTGWKRGSEGEKEIDALYSFANCDATYIDLSGLIIKSGTNFANFVIWPVVTLKWANWKHPINLSQCARLSAESVVDLVANLATVEGEHTLTLGSAHLAKLTDEQIAEAANKGWTLA